MVEDRRRSATSIDVGRRDRRRQRRTTSTTRAKDASTGPDPISTAIFVVLAGLGALAIASGHVVSGAASSR
ncbi:MAG TPA: hypothetical protein VF502_04275 [Stellaceae bacterium]